MSFGSDSRLCRNDRLSGHGLFCSSFASAALQHSSHRARQGSPQVRQFRPQAMQESSRAITIVSPGSTRSGRRRLARHSSFGRSSSPSTTRRTVRIVFWACFSSSSSTSSSNLFLVASSLLGRSEKAEFSLNLGSHIGEDVEKISFSKRERNLRTGVDRHFKLPKLASRKREPESCKMTLKTWGTESGEVSFSQEASCLSPQRICPAAVSSLAGVALLEIESICLFFHLEDGAE